jgi:acetylornithine deacetylase/succinyl-diaminopimelate desuccinylase-like protein
MHGIDEAVELDSIVAGARVLARFMDAWLALPKAEAR